MKALRRHYLIRQKVISEKIFVLARNKAEALSKASAGEIEEADDPWEDDHLKYMYIMPTPVDPRGA